MNVRQLALAAYYYGTYPVRMAHRRQLAAKGTLPLGVAFYHRIADDCPNAWSMTNDQFERQMLWLKRHCDIVSLREIQSRVRSGHNDRSAVAITFDDGYAENCDRAIPFLLEHDIPFTYFVALDFIVNQRPFPQDVKAGELLAPNTPEQIRAMADAGVEIGAHTRTHCDVGAIDDPKVLVDEIVTAKNELSALAGCPIRYFAFPYGQVSNLSAAAVELVRREGMLGVCSAYGAYNFPGEDPFHLQRFHGDPEFIRFKNWSSIDRRKLSAGRGFEFPEAKVSVEQIPKLESQQSVPQQSVPGMFPSVETGSTPATSSSASSHG